MGYCHDADAGLISRQEECGRVQDLKVDLGLCREWEPGYRLGTGNLLGQSFHIEAIEIKPCKCGGGLHWCADTEAVDPIREDQLREIYVGWGGEGPWECVEWEGKWWIVLVLPFCD
jgi:hypothetical protein